MKLTVRHLKAVYGMLCQFPPFNRWGMPPVGNVRFSVRVDPDSAEEVLAHYNTSASGQHLISFDGRQHWTISKLVAILAHEMVHLRQEVVGRRPANKDEQHNGTFKELARQVCQQLGFDGSDF